MTAAYDSCLKAEMARVRDATVGVPAEWLAAAREGVEDELAWSRAVLPVLAWGTPLALCFGALETLLSELVEVCEDRGVAPFENFERGRKAPTIERYRLYLEHSA